MKQLLILFLVLPLIGQAQVSSSGQVDLRSKDYYANGRVSRECYEIPSGLNVCLNYADSSKKVITSGSRGTYSELIFKNEKLVEIRTKRVIYSPPPIPLDLGHSYTSLQVADRGDCIEKGEFRNFELYNGFIYYYAEDGALELTEKVSKGVNIYNPEVEITDSTIKSAMGNTYDRNLNGRLEQREAKLIQNFHVFLADSLIQEVDWTQLKMLENLESVQVNQLRYPLDRFQPGAALTEAIVSRKGFKKHQERTIYDFLDLSPSFPGGYEALMKYIDSNLVYPQSDIYKRHEGNVYVRFVVDWDGSISNIEILRGTTEEANREAKRLIREMPDWIPGEHDGFVVPCRVTIPVTFRIP